ncbi:MAG: hypothetical protein JWM00_808 [Candidatus Saccharibacteria bacterium]|nr:hypothetical protein [Candidatus Saccharibacteria bacterium]
MPCFPELDLPDYIPSDLELRMQSAAVLDSMHDESEAATPLYGVTHRAVQLAGQASLDTPQLIDAINTGVKVFESIGHFVHPDNIYDTEAGRVLTLVSARQFLGSILSADDFLQGMDYAAERLAADTPDLAAFIEEVAGRYYDHDLVATKFALKGAAAVRGMQIFVDRRLALADTV